MTLKLFRLAAASSLLLTATAPGSGASAPSRGSVPLDLVAPPPQLRASDHGSVEPAMEGFGTISRPGEPALPVKILLVAIPAGATPELILHHTVTRELRHLDVAPVPREHLRDRRGADQGIDESERRNITREYRRDERIFSRDGLFPEAPVRLGGIGYLRDQRYVEVLYSPLQVNPARQTGRYYPRIEAEVVFDIPEGSLLSGPFRPDPYFESTYAAGLVNYEQGKLFRATAPAPAPSDTRPLRSEAAAAAGITPEANGTRYKLLVSHAGVHRVDYTTLLAQAPDIVGADPRTLSIQMDGVEIPIAVRNASGMSGEDDGQFNPGDVLEFYAAPKVEPPTVLNFDMGTVVPDVYEANDFTDTQVYWLQSSGAPGSHARIPDRAGAPISGFTQAADFGDTVVWEENNFFLPLGGADLYYSVPSLLAGGSAAQRDIAVNLGSPASAGPSATVTVRLRGGSDTPQDPDHRTKAWVNGDTAHNADFTWNGETIREVAFTVPQSSLAGASTFHLQAVTLSGVAVDRQYPDTITVNFRRLFTASGETLTFTIPNQSLRIQVSGMTMAAPTIYEIGRPIPGNGEPNAVRITGAVPGGVPTPNWTFEMAQDTSPGAPATRTFLVAGPSAFRVPDAIVAAQPEALRTPGLAADYIVIAARSAVDASPGGALDLLLQHRLATQGLTSRVVYIDQVYDEFSFGRHDANAVRSFLAYAYANWRGPAGTDPAPSFVLLVGDATSDYKNNLGRTDWIDQVPTPIMLQDNLIIGFYSSDNYLAAFNGPDQIPDVHLGRISTRTAAKSAQVFDKIRQFELSTPAGTWKGRGVLTASDEKVAGEADSFQAINDTLRAEYFSVAPASSPSPPLYFAQPPWNSTDAAGFHLSLMTELQNGASVLTYVGHGSFDTWGLETVMTAADAGTLTNGLRLPFMLNINCLSGGFHYLPESGSLAEAMVNNPNGGAIAAFAPSGLSNAPIGTVIADNLFLPLLGPEREPMLGVATDPVRLALWNLPSIVDLQGYTFLGDPASRLATPAPPPPTSLSATAGTGQVALAWSAPAVPAAATRLYRAAANPAGTYSAITCTSTGPTSCTDQTVLNATRYYYYAVSVDAEGFEGAASNFNTGCDAGPDCVTALPTNALPPGAPSGLLVHDAGSGGRLNVTWSPNPESDLKRYTVYYGTQPGVYGVSLTTNPGTTSATLIGLTDGVRYYVTVTATNTSDHESAPAPEQSEVPHLFEGIAPPRAISDLTITISGSNLVLSWSRPLVDIYGRATTVVGYKVYRGTTANFQIAGTTPLATIASGATTTFTHTGGVILPGDSYYLVTATDSGGLVSGAGRDLPNGIGDLGASFTAPSTVHLSWFPVTTDIQGLPTLIDHYQVHVTSVPVARGSLGPATLFMDNVSGTSVDLTLPSSPRFISLLAVDNRGNLSPY
jgi:hypothetical protein